MRTILFLCLFFFTFSFVNSQVTAPPDSILKKVENLKNVSAIKHLVNKYSNGKTKSEGWAYLFQEGKKTMSVRLGHWKYFHKDGVLEFEDFMPVNDDLPIIEKHYDKEGVLTKEVFVKQEFDKNKNLKGDTFREVAYFPSGKVKSRSYIKNKKKVNTWTVVR